MTTLIFFSLLLISLVSTSNDNDDYNVYDNDNHHRVLSFEDVSRESITHSIHSLKTAIDNDDVDQFMSIFEKTRLYPTIISNIRSMTENNSKFRERLIKYMIYNTNYSDHYIMVGRFLLRSKLLNELPETIDELKHKVCHSYNRDISFYLRCSKDVIQFTYSINRDRKIADIIFTDNIPRFVYEDELVEW